MAPADLLTRKLLSLTLAPLDAAVAAIPHRSPRTKVFVMSTDPAALVVGVDFGTLSGRAVVVRVDDGAELGSAVTDYRHGVVDRRLPGSGRELPPDWALQVPA